MGRWNGVVSPTDLQRLLDQLPDPTVLLGPDGAIRWANAAAEELSGLPGDDAIGVNVLEILHPDDHSVVLNAIVPRTTRPASAI